MSCVDESLCCRKLNITAFQTASVHVHSKGEDITSSRLFSAETRAADLDRGRSRTVEGALCGAPKPTNTPGVDEAGLGNSGGLSHILLLEITEVILKLNSCKAPGVDEIRPGTGKAVDVVVLSG